MISSLVSKHGFALIVGVSRYRKKRSWTYVPNAVPDSKAIARVLENLYHFTPLLLTDNKATKERIISVLKYIQQNSIKSSKFIFVFTGKIESGQLCCYNYHRKKRNTTAISLKSLDDRISNIYGRNKLVIVNAKYSSKLFEDIQSADLLCSQNIKEKLWLENGSGIFMSKLCSVLNYQTVKDLFSILDLMDVLGAFLPRETDKDAIREILDGVDPKNKSDEDGNEKGEHLFHPILACRDEESPFFFSRKTQQRFEDQQKKEKKKKKKPRISGDDDTVIEPFDDDNKFRSATLVDLPKLSGYTLLRSKLINSIVHDLCSAELSEEDKSERATILRSISMSLLTVEETQTQEKLVVDKKIVVLIGQKGYGKTMTANIVAHNPEVTKNFDFVFYFNMRDDGSTDRHLMKCQRKIISEFTKEIDFFDSIEKGKSQMKKYFDLLRPKILIILDDLRDQMSLNAFLFTNSKNLKLMITTCTTTTNIPQIFEGLKKEKRSEYVMGEMNEFDCIVLFSEVLQIESFRIQGKISEGLGPVRKVFELCKHQPLCLSLVANILCDVNMDEWDFRIRSIQAVEVPPSDRKYMSLRHHFLYQTIYFFVEDMERMERESQNIVMRQLHDAFLSLSLIPSPSVWVPISIVKFFMGDDSIETTYKKIIALNKIGLVRIEYYENEVCINIHEIIFEVVRSKSRKDYTEIQIKFLRRLVVNTRGRDEDNNEYKSMFLNNAKWYQWKDRTTLLYDQNYRNIISILGKEYILKYISHHLSEGKTTNRCIENLLLSIEWYSVVYNHFRSFDTLLDDFHRLEGFPYNIQHREFTFLYHAFKLMLPIIHSRFGELKQQMIGRLSTIKFDRVRLLVNRLRAQMHGKLYPYSRFSGLEVPSAKLFEWVGHEGKIDVMDVSFDSMSVITLSKEDQTMIIWDLGGEKPGSIKEKIEINSFYNNNMMINNVFLRFGLNNSIVIVLDDSIYRRVAEDNIFRLKFKSKNNSTIITAFETSEDYYFFICATTGMEITYHSIGSGNILLTIPIKNIVTSITLFGAGSHICYGNSIGEIVVFRMENKKELARWTPHPGFCINQVCVGFDKYVFSCASDRKIIMSDWNSDFQREFKGHTDAVTELILSVHNDWLVTTGWDGKIILWDVVSGRKISQFIEQKTRSVINCLKVTPNRKWILTTQGTNLSAWDFKLKREDKILGEGDRVTSNLCLFKNGRYVVYGTSDGRVRFRDMDTLDEPYTFSHTPSQKQTSNNPVICVSVTNRNNQPRSVEDELVFAVYKNDEWVRVWRISTGELEDRVNPFGETLWNVFWWRSNLVVSSGGIFPNEEVRVWDIRSGITKEVLLRNRKVFDMTVSTGGKKYNNFSPFVICKNIYTKRIGTDVPQHIIDYGGNQKMRKNNSDISKSMENLRFRNKKKKNTSSGGGLRRSRSSRNKLNKNKLTTTPRTIKSSRGMQRIKSDMGFNSSSRSSTKSSKKTNTSNNTSPRNKLLKRTGSFGDVRINSNSKFSRGMKSTGNIQKLRRSSASNNNNKSSTIKRMKKISSMKSFTPLPRKVNPNIFNFGSRAQTKTGKNGMVISSTSTYTKRKKKKRNIQTALPGMNVTSDIFENNNNNNKSSSSSSSPRNNNNIKNKKQSSSPRSSNNNNSPRNNNNNNTMRRSSSSKRRRRHVRTKSESGTKTLMNVQNFGNQSPKSRRKVRHLADIFYSDTTTTVVDSITKNNNNDLSSIIIKNNNDDDDNNNNPKDIKTLRVDHQFTVINLETQMVVSVPYPSRNKLSQIVVNKHGKSFLFGYMGEKVLKFSLETVSEDVVLFCTEERRKIKKVNCITNIQCSECGMYLVVVFDKNIISLYHNESTGGGNDFIKKSTYSVKEKVKDIIILKRRNMVYIICATDQLVFLRYSGK